MRRNWQRVLVKITGEAFCGEDGYGINPDAVGFVAEEIAGCVRLGKEVAVVVGGGNIIRGREYSREVGIGRSTADYMGMLATLINALALQDALEASGFETRVMSAIYAHQVAEPFIRRRATRHLEKGRIVILAGGTGNPYFSTDTQAAIRAREINAQVFLKATKVDGVYSADPEKDSSAKLFETISYTQYLELDLKVMDRVAVELCQRMELPIVVFRYSEKGALADAASGRNIGTFITDLEMRQ